MAADADAAAVVERLVPDPGRLAAVVADEHDLADRQRLGEDVEPYFAGKGTFRFRVDQPIPTKLITRIVALLLEERVDQ